MAGSVAYIEVIPSLKGFAQLITAQGTTAAKSAGAKAGQSFTQGLTAGLEGATKAAQAAVDELTTASAKASAQIKRESANIAAARNAEKAAALGVQAAEQKLAEAREKHGATSSQALKAEQQLTLAQGKSEQAALKVTAATDQISAAYEQQKVVTGQLATAQTDLEKAQLAANSGSAKLAKGLGAAESSVTSMGSRIGGLVKSMGSMAAFFGMFAAAEGVKAAVESASKFQSSMTLLVTAGGEAASALPAVATGIQNIAKSTGTSTEQLAEGMYTIEKAGIRGASGLNVLKAAAQGAAAESVDLGTMTNALTSIMRSYNLPASKAVTVTNELVAASGASKTTMQEFAGSLSTVLPVASAAGISFAQVGGAIATLTSHGTSADEATQELANTIRNLQAPNQVAQKAMQQLGLSVNDVTTNLGKRGLSGTIDLITQAISSKLGPQGTVLIDTFKKSQSASQDLNVMLGKMPSSLRTLSQSYLSGQTSLKEYRTAIRDMGSQGYAMGSQFLSLAGQAQGFNNYLRSGQPAAQTYTAQLKAMLGGATGLNTALMLTGGSSATFASNIAKVAAAAKTGGANVSTWAATQATFKVQMDKLSQSFAVTAQQATTKLLPIFTQMAQGVLAATQKVSGFIAANKSWLGPLTVGLLSAYAAFKLVGVGVAVFNGVLKVGEALGFTFTAMTKGMKAAMVAYKMATVQATGAQEALDVAEDANPFGVIALAIEVVVAALVALTVGVMYAYNHWTWFRTGVQAAWKGIQVAASFAWNNVLKPTFAALSDGLTQIGQGATWLWQHAITPAFDGIVDAINWVKTAAKDVGNAFAVSWNAIGVAVSWSYKSIIKPVFDAFAQGAQQIGTAMSWLYTNIFKPVFAGIGAVLTWFWDTYVAVFTLIAVVIRDVVGAAALWLWRNVFVPAFNGISSAAQWAWNKILSPILTALWNALKMVGSWGVWLWQNAIVPMWNGIVAASQLAWNKVILPIVTAFWNGLKTIGSWAVWLWQSAFVPAWNAISSAAQWAWAKVIHPTFAAVWGGLQTIGHWASWLWKSVIVPVWDGIGSTISGFWKNTVKPAFDALGGWLSKTGPKLFDGFKDAVKTAWSGIKTAFTVPVKFVIKTVIDDTLIDGFNKVAVAVEGKNNAKTIQPIPLPKGFAGGGVLPGYQSAKRDELMVPMRKGEGVLVPEVVRALGPGFVNALNKAGNSGGVGGVRKLAGFASGGVVADAWDWTTNAAKVAASVLSNPGVAISSALNGVLGKIPGAGSALDLAKGVGSSLVSMARSAFTSLFGGKGSSGGGSVANPTGSGVTRWTADVIKALAANGLSTSTAMVQKVLRQIQTESGGNPTIKQQITDINSIEGHPAQGLMQTIPSTFAAYAFPGHGNILNGYDNLLAALNYAKHAYGPSLSALGQGHGYSTGGVVGLYDNGGMLPTGLSVVANKTGSPEPVLTPQQWKLLAPQSGHGRADQRTMHFHNYGREFGPREYIAAERQIDALR